MALETTSTVEDLVAVTAVVYLDDEVVASTAQTEEQIAVSATVAINDTLVDTNVLALAGPKGDTGEGLTPGGSSGEFLIKTGSDDYDADWFPFLNTMVPTDSTHRWTTDTEKALWNADHLALGETELTAYRGDRGKIGYEHTLVVTGNPHNVTKGEVGLANANNTSDADKPISDDTQAALDLKLDIDTAAATYLPLQDLDDYLTIADAASTYLEISTAASTYLTIANAGATYLSSATAASVYQTQAAMSNYYDKASSDVRYATPQSVGAVAGDLLSHTQLGDTAHGGIVYKTRLINGKALSADITLSTADVPDTSDRRYVTDAQKAIIGSGTVSAVTQANGLTLTAGTLALGAASASTAGGLSSADWNTFNGKENAGVCLKLDQSTPQTVINGAPTISQGLKLGLTPTIADPVPVGLVYWDATEGAMAYGITGGDITIGAETFGIYTDMTSGHTLIEGDIVSIVGVTGNRTGVNLTNATSTASSTACIGMVTAIGLPGDKVRVTKMGAVHGLDTHLLTEGFPVYVDPANPGKWTQSYPAAPDYAITVGVVTVSNNSAGVIDIQTGYAQRLEDLSDVNGTALTVSGQIPVWDNTHKYFDFTANLNDYLRATGATTGATSQAQAFTLGITSSSLSLTGTINATELSIQTFAGQTAAAFQAGNISGGTYFSVSPLGSISINGGTTTGITDILVNPAVKASGSFVDFQVGTASKARIEYDGTIRTPKLYGLNGVALILSTGATNGALTIQNENYNGTASKTAITLLGGTNSMTAGTFVGLKLSSIYNQATGTASNTDLEINRTNTAVGSGLQLFWDTKLGGVSIASMDTAGNLRISSDAAGLKLGAGADMLVSYDGTIGKIDSSLVAASDLHIVTGTAKTLVLDTVVYKDQLGAALSLQQTGSGISRNIPEATVDYTTGANNTDYMVENFQFNHERKAGTPVNVHLHWLQAETNTPNWAIQYRWQLGGTAKTTSWTAAKRTSNAFTWTTGTLNQITSFAALTPAANEGLSPILQVRFIRDTSNALGLVFAADPYTATVAVIAVDAHYQIDTHGSRTEYSK